MEETLEREEKIDAEDAREGDASAVPAALAADAVAQEGSAAAVEDAANRAGEPDTAELDLAADADAADSAPAAGADADSASSDSSSDAEPGAVQDPEDETPQADSPGDGAAVRDAGEGEKRDHPKDPTDGEGSLPHDGQPAAHAPLTRHLVAIEPPAEPGTPLPQFAELAQARPIHVRLRRPATVDIRHDRRLKLVIAFLAAGLALAFALASVALAVWGGSQAFVTMLPGKVPVRVVVDAPGLDVSTGSRVPLRLVGVTEDGDTVDEIAFVDQAGDGLSVEPGTYEVSVAGSPIAGDGTVYSVPEAVVAFDVPAVADAQLDADPFKLEPLSPQDTTEQSIDDAYRYAVQGGCSVERAPELKVAAEQRAGLA